MKMGGRVRLLAAAVVWCGAMGAARTQSLQCANAVAFSVLGEGKVLGMQFCSRFDDPDGRRVNICLDLFKVGDNKYELRNMGEVTTLLYRLTR
jgi:hypothetical protein